MYQPRHFRESDQNTLRELIRQRPLATLISASPQGLMADHIPLVVAIDDTGKMLLRGHIARANPLFAQLQAELSSTLSCELSALAIFHGPQGYISPGWYPEKREHGQQAQVVPTWNYVAVHARGQLRLVSDAIWLHQQLRELTDQQEAGSAQPWSVDDAPDEFTQRLSKAIVGIELAVDDLQGQWKLSQNKNAATRGQIVDGLQQRAQHEDQALAKLMMPATVELDGQ